MILEIDSHDVHSMERALKGVLAAVFYGVCSVSSAFMSKALMGTMEFDFPVSIMVAQMILTVCVLELLTIFNFIDLPPYTVKRGLTFVAPAFFYGTNSVLALTALSHMNIAMYGVLKRCVPLFTLFFSLLILKKGCPDRMTIASVIMLTVGCVIAGELKFF